jgi:hypothetical protein
VQLVRRLRAADITGNSPMIWFFTRGSAQVDIEVRRVPDAELFELVIDYPDGSEGVERFRNPKKLVERTLAVQRRLIKSGWTPTSPGHHPRTQVATPPKHIKSRRRTLRAVPRVWAYVQKRVRERLAATFGF